MFDAGPLGNKRPVSHDVVELTLPASLRHSSSSLFYSQPGAIGLAILIMGLYNKLPDDIREVDVIIVGGKYPTCATQCWVSPTY
jgi:hypothetical protein